MFSIFILIKFNFINFKPILFIHYILTAIIQGLLIYEPLNAERNNNLRLISIAISALSLFTLN